MRHKCSSRNRPPSAADTLAMNAPTSMERAVNMAALAAVFLAASAGATLETACAPLPIVENTEVARVPATRTVATDHIDDTHSITMSHIAVVTANVVAVTPWPGQGEIAAKPSPEPRASPCLAHRSRAFNCTVRKSSVV